jgi:hypothetical protein
VTYDGEQSVHGQLQSRKACTTVKLFSVVHDNFSNVCEQEEP